MVTLSGTPAEYAIFPKADQAWPVPFYSSELNTIAPVRQIQIIQETLQAITVRIAVDEALTPDQEAGIRELVGRRLGTGFVISLETVDEIPRSASGKYQDFISRVR